MSLAMLIAGAVSAYSRSREKDKDKDDSIEMLRERYRMDREDRAADRARRGEEFDAWSAYAPGGAQGGMWNQQGNSFGLLQPSNFMNRPGATPAPAMPWGQPPQQQPRQGGILGGFGGRG
jgi:hypothetical protein